MVGGDKENHISPRSVENLIDLKLGSWGLGEWEDEGGQGFVASAERWIFPGNGQYLQYLATSVHLCSADTKVGFRLPDGIQTRQESNLIAIDYLLERGYLLHLPLIQWQVEPSDTTPTSPAHHPKNFLDDTGAFPLLLAEALVAR